VTPESADVTTATRGHSLRARQTIPTALLIASALPTDVPPNFMTSVPLSAGVWPVRFAEGLVCELSRAINDSPRSGIKKAPHLRGALGVLLDWILLAANPVQTLLPHAKAEGW
jgi:hypothetical protein